MEGWLGVREMKVDWRSLSGGWTEPCPMLQVCGAERCQQQSERRREQHQVLEKKLSDRRRDRGEPPCCGLGHPGRAHEEGERDDVGDTKSG